MKTKAKSTVEYTVRGERFFLEIPGTDERALEKAIAKLTAEGATVTDVRVYGTLKL